MILPWITLAIVQAAVYTRLSRGSLLDTLGEDYIRTARSKGISERRVLYRHAVRSAMTPVVSQLGIDIGALLGGVLVVEQVFGLQGSASRPSPRSARATAGWSSASSSSRRCSWSCANLIVDMLLRGLHPHSGSADLRIRLS